MRVYSLELRDESLELREKAKLSTYLSQLISPASGRQAQLFSIYYSLFTIYYSLFLKEKPPASRE
jgi:hypothetical protein